MSSWAATTDPTPEDRESKKPTGVAQDARKPPALTYSQALRKFSSTEDRSLAPPLDRYSSARLSTALPINYSQATLNDDRRGSDTSLDSKITGASSSLTRTVSTNSEMDIDIPEFPLFIVEHKIAWDNDMHFSRYGDEFRAGLASLDRDTVPVVHDLIQRTNPAKTRELEIDYTEDPYASDLEERKIIIFRPGSNAARRLLKKIYPLKKSWDPLSIPDKSTLVDTDEELADFMAVIQAVKPHDIELFCDCEGNKLGRNGTLSLLQIMFASLDHTWVLDIAVLKTKAFDTKGPNGRSLREILEDETIFKIFYDIRNDADALFSHHGIHMRHVIDMQLLELATRQEFRRGRRGLSKCMTNASKEIMSWQEAAVWKYHKDNGKYFCEGPRVWAVFNERPLRPVLLRYAVNDVAWMPALFSFLCKRGRSNDMDSSQRGRDSMALVLRESERMVLHSTFDGYDPDGSGYIRGRAPPVFDRLRDWSEDDCDEEFWNE